MQQFIEVRRTRTTYTVIALKHIQGTLYLICSEMRSQCNFSRRGVEWWWWGAKRTSLAAKFCIFLERLDDRIRCTHEETVAVVEHAHKLVHTHTQSDTHTHSDTHVHHSPMPIITMPVPIIVNRASNFAIVKISWIRVAARTLIEFTNIRIPETESEITIIYFIALLHA